ncbi:restriction endonuclease subunit S [Nocardia heshunensis]
MEASETQLGDVLTLERIPVDIVLDAEYRQIGIKSFGKGIFHRDPCSGFDLSKLKYFEVHPGRLIVSNIMAWEGAIGISTEREEGLVGSARFLSYRPTGDVDIRYLNYYFQTSDGISLIRSASTGTVARNQTLSPKNFEKSTVPLPGLDEQRRVADKLDAAMSRIARFTTLREHSERVVNQHRDSLLRPINDRAPLSVALCQSYDFVEVESESQYAITGIFSFGRGLIKRPAILGSDTSYASLTRLHAGQAVISKLGAWEGALAVVNDAFDKTYVSPEYPTFDINSANADPSYIEHLFSWPSLWSSLTTRGSMARRKRTTPATFLATEVPFPALPEQRRIARQLSTVRRTIAAGAEQSAQVTALRSALLNAAFSGQL